METKEAILATIDELNNVDLSEESDVIQNDVDSADLAQDMQDSGESNKPNIFIDIKEELDSLANSGISDEVSLLLRLKEKSLVLFEGLRAAQNKDAEIKLEMVISYLEYQLYMIEDRLKSLESS